MSITTHYEDGMRYNELHREINSYAIENDTLRERLKKANATIRNLEYKIYFLKKQQGISDDIIEESTLSQIF